MEITVARESDSYTPSKEALLNRIRSLIAEDYAELEHQLKTAYQSDIQLINEVSSHIVASGGKRIRPLCLLLAAHAVGFHDTKSISAATAIEYIHTATLLHDDVVDESNLRRNHPTARKIWGNMASILVGDYLYSQAFALLLGLNHPEVMAILVTTTKMLAEGEAFQLMNRNNTRLTEKDYRYIIANKTGVLFETATLLAATLANSSANQKDALARYGMHLGLAFQMIDDALDYHGDSAMIGKNIGDDLAEGSPTLPVIYALAHGNKAQKTLLENAIRKGSLDNLDDIIMAIKETAAIEYTIQCAHREADLALAALEELPASHYRDALADLARFAVSREY